MADSGNFCDVELDSHSVYYVEPEDCPYRAFFSTEGYTRPPRAAGDPPPPAIARSHPRKDKEAMIARLRARWPDVCYSIFGKSEVGTEWDLRWFFDEHDYYVQGGRFLYDVIYTIMKQNEKMVVDLAKNWSECHKNVFLSWPHPADMFIENVFHAEDKNRFPEPFLQQVLTVIKGTLTTTLGDHARARDRVMRAYPGIHPQFIPNIPQPSLPPAASATPASQVSALQQPGVYDATRPQSGSQDQRIPSKEGTRTPRATYGVLAPTQHGPTATPRQAHSKPRATSSGASQPPPMPLAAAAFHQPFSGFYPFPPVFYRGQYVLPPPPPGMTPVQQMPPNYLPHGITLVSQPGATKVEHQQNSQFQSKASTWAVSGDARLYDPHIDQGRARPGNGAQTYDDDNDPASQTRKQSFGSIRGRRNSNRGRGGFKSFQRRSSASQNNGDANSTNISRRESLCNEPAWQDQSDSREPCRGAVESTTPVTAPGRFSTQPATADKGATSKKSTDNQETKRFRAPLGTLKQSLNDSVDQARPNVSHPLPRPDTQPSAVISTEEPSVQSSMSQSKSYDPESLHKLGHRDALAAAGMAVTPANKVGKHFVGPDVEDVFQLFVGFYNDVPEETFIQALAKVAAVDKIFKRTSPKRSGCFAFIKFYSTSDIRRVLSQHRIPCQDGSLKFETCYGDRTEDLPVSTQRFERHRKSISGNSTHNHSRQNSKSTSSATWPGRQESTVKANAGEVPANLYSAQDARSSTAQAVPVNKPTQQAQTWAKIAAKVPPGPGSPQSERLKAHDGSTVAKIPPENSTQGSRQPKVSESAWAYEKPEEPVTGLEEKDVGHSANEGTRPTIIATRKQESDMAPRLRAESSEQPVKKSATSFLGQPSQDSASPDVQAEPELGGAESEIDHSTGQTSLQVGVNGTPEIPSSTTIETEYASPQSTKQLHAYYSPPEQAQSSQKSEPDQPKTQQNIELPPFANAAFRPETPTAKPQVLSATSEIHRSDTLATAQEASTAQSAQSSSSSESQSGQNSEGFTADSPSEHVKKKAIPAQAQRKSKTKKKKKSPREKSPAERADHTDRFASGSRMDDKSGRLPLGFACISRPSSIKGTVSAERESPSESDHGPSSSATNAVELNIQVERSNPIQNNCDAKDSKEPDSAVMQDGSVVYAAKQNTNEAPKTRPGDGLQNESSASSVASSTKEPSLASLQSELGDWQKEYNKIIKTLEKISEPHKSAWRAKAEKLQTELEVTASKIFENDTKMLSSDASKTLRTKWPKKRRTLLESHKVLIDEVMLLEGQVQRDVEREVEEMRENSRKAYPKFDLPSATAEMPVVPKPPKPMRSREAFAEEVKNYFDGKRSYYSVLDPDSERSVPRPGIEQVCDEHDGGPAVTQPLTDDAGEILPKDRALVNLNAQWDHGDGALTISLAEEAGAGNLGEILANPAPGTRVVSVGAQNENDKPHSPADEPSPKAQATSSTISVRQVAEPGSTSCSSPTSPPTSAEPTPTVASDSRTAPPSATDQPDPPPNSPASRPALSPVHSPAQAGVSVPKSNPLPTMSYAKAAASNTVGPKPLEGSKGKTESSEKTANTNANPPLSRRQSNTTASRASSTSRTGLGITGTNLLHPINPAGDGNRVDDDDWKLGPEGAWGSRGLPGRRKGG